jgi:hypothetical protein
MLAEREEQKVLPNFLQIFPRLYLFLKVSKIFKSEIQYFARRKIISKQNKSMIKV